MKRRLIVEVNVDDDEPVIAILDDVRDALEEDGFDVVTVEEAGR